MRIARLAANIALALVAVFLIVASLVFSAAVAGWLMFSVALGVLALVGLAQLDRHASVVEHVLDGLTGTLAIWATVASVVFAGDVVTWGSFAYAAAFTTLAVAAAGVATYEIVKGRLSRKATAAPLEPARPAEELRAVA
jgi:hypothetical protein